MAYDRRDIRGGAVQTTLTGNVSSSDVTFSIASATGWPTGGANGSFYVVIDPGVATEEKILCSSRSTLSVTVAGSGTGRGADGTTPAAHASGAAVYPVITATDIDEANYTATKTVGKVTATGQVLVGDGVNSLAAVDAKTAGQILVGNGTSVASVPVSGDVTLTSAGVATIGAGKVTSANLVDGTIVNADVNASAGILHSKMESDARARANHTGTQLAATISDLSTATVATVAGLNGLEAAGVNVDDATIEISSDNIRVKALGVGTTQLADDAVTLAKLGSDWIAAATVATSEARTTATYGVLSTAGAAVTLTTGTKVLVRLTMTASIATPGVVAASFTVSGATTLAADDTRAVIFDLTGGAGWPRRASAEVYLSTLTAGSNTFTMQYKGSGGASCTFSDRTISVICIPE